MDSADWVNQAEPAAWRRALRQRMIAARVALPAGECAAASAQIRARIEARWADDVLGRVVAFCWPVQNEPDLVPLMASWQVRGVRPCLPVVVRPGQALAFRAWWPEQPLQPDRYGIPTPTDGDFLRPDFLFIPCNAFDVRAFRLGYGGGFFDRTLAELGAGSTAIGVAYDFQRVDDTRPQVHDLPLAAVVTERALYLPHEPAASAVV